MQQLGLSPPALARMAQLSPNTVRKLINGEVWPRPESRARLNLALDWPDGEIARRSAGLDPRLRQFSLTELLDEVMRRVRLLEGA